VAPSASYTAVDSNPASSTPVTLAAAATVSDVDNLNLASATVSISSGFFTGDVLAANVAGTNIKASYVPATGVLTLTGSDTLAHYQQVLDSVTYSSTSANPTDFNTDPGRTISWVVNDGTLPSATATTTVSITAVDTPPVVTDTTGATTWTEASGLGPNPAVVIDSRLTVSDADNTTLASATVSITNFVSGEDVLAFTNTSSSTYGNVSAGYNSSSGVLTLTSAGATATVAQWQAALEAVTYNDTSHNPSGSSRTISFVANDGQLASAASTKTVNIVAVDTPPVATTPTSYSATEQQSLNLKNSGMSVSDVDSLGGVETMTLSVTEGTLTVTAGGSGATVQNSGSNSVTISGTLAQINALLNTDGTSTVSYIDNTYAPSASATLTLSINDNGHTGSGGALTGSDTATINITPIVSATTYKTFDSSTQNSSHQTNQTEIDLNHGTATITLTFGGPVTYTGSNMTLTVADGDEVPPNNDNDFATYNASLSNPTQGVLVFTYIPDSDGLTHALAIIGVNGTIRDANNNIVNTTPFVGVLSNHVHTNGTIVQEHLGVNEAAAPAGVAGDPINLALTDLSGEPSGPITVTVAGVLLDWSLDQGTNLGGGIWAVQTSDPTALTVRTPANFAGAALLNVTESWANADGSTGTAGLRDNVEAYAPGAPIFALSSNDTLTGASGNDLFVFAQPIGNDTIYNFNAGTDRIDLIGFNTLSSFSDLQANLTNDANGDAVITIGADQTITLHGVDAASLTANDFVFNQTPVIDNAGSIVIGDGATLPLSGMVNNTGIIALNSTGDETDLQLIQHGITLQGGGQVILSDSSQNVISGTDPSVTLTNIDNTISGAGHLGNGQLTLINDGTIVATGTHALVIDTGANLITNSGTLQSTGTGGLVIYSDVSNSGLLWADGGNLTVHGNVSGSGSAIIDGSAVLEFTGVDSSSVIFHSATGELILDHSAGFTGTISGFTGDGTLAGSDQIDLRDINFSSLEQSSYADGVLTVSDGVHTAHLAFDGSYQLANFKYADDGQAGTIVYDPPVPDASTADAEAGTAGAADSFAFKPDLAHDMASELKTLGDAGQIDHPFLRDFLHDLYHATGPAGPAAKNDVATAFQPALQQVSKDQPANNSLAGNDGPNALTAHGADGVPGAHGNAGSFAATDLTSHAFGSNHHPSGLGTPGSDSFVFASNFGRHTIADSSPALDLSASNHASVDHIQEIVAASAHDLAAHIVTAAGAPDQSALQTLTQDQLQHLANGHWV
jgi:hypothetical protein